ncbi:MAG: isocitrate lyase/phosphoenolpyruvate mutase family protein [Burkholderiales bacterium]|nr:isocitrate lyase/phosphoenolpyruvate mutase family protein [Burkholderiales bacterium]
MGHTEERRKFRAVLAGTRCLSPASVYDPLSARIAESVGFEIGMLAGSVASHTTLAAPDLIVLTLTEFAGQIRRIKRASRLPLLVDADHGYGNALNVMRTVWELDHAGVAAMSIEDPVLPQRFGQADAAEELVSTAEMVGKLRAAVEARGGSNVVIAGRTAALRIEGIEGTVARVKAYAATGVDAIFVVGLETLAQLEAIRAAAQLPVIIGSAPASLQREDLAARGARVLLQGHQPVAAAVKALRECYEHLHRGGSPAELKDRIASAQEMDRLTGAAEHKRWQREFLR